MIQNYFAYLGPEMQANSQVGLIATGQHLGFRQEIWQCDDSAAGQFAKRTKVIAVSIHRAVG